jgi:hypothetical protein
LARYCLKGGGGGGGRGTGGRRVRWMKEIYDVMEEKGLKKDGERIKNNKYWESEGDGDISVILYN